MHVDDGIICSGTLLGVCKPRAKVKEVVLHGVVKGGLTLLVLMVGISTFGEEQFGNLLLPF